MTVANVRGKEHGSSPSFTLVTALGYGLGGTLVIHGVFQVGTLCGVHRVGLAAVGPLKTTVCPLPWGDFLHRTGSLEAAS